MILDRIRKARTDFRLLLGRSPNTIHIAPDLLDALRREQSDPSHSVGSKVVTIMGMAVAPRADPWTFYLSYVSAEPLEEPQGFLGSGEG